MDSNTYKIFALDVLIPLSMGNQEAYFSYKGRHLLIDGLATTASVALWTDEARNLRGHFFLEKAGLIGANLSCLGEVWKASLSQETLTGQQLKAIAEKTLPRHQADTDSTISKWRRSVEARLLEKVPTLECVERLAPSATNDTNPALELAPILAEWPNRLLYHPEWSCAESPLPEIPPLPLDEVWVDLQITEPSRTSSLSEETTLAQAMEQRYWDTQWTNMPADFVLESLRGTMVLVGAPGVGKTTLMKWVARQLIKNSEGRYLLPLFIPLRAYALAKASQPDIDILSFGLKLCGITTTKQVQQWSSAISHLSGIERNSVLVLLDGWDEVPNDMRETLLSEIKHLSYGFGIIITSRPSAYPRALPADQFYEISDLPPENIVALTHRWHETMKQPQRADILLSHLDQYPDLRRLARNPFLLNLLCVINIEGISGRVLPRNRTELFSHTLRYIYDHHTRKNATSPFTDQNIAQTQQLALWLLNEAPQAPQYIFGAHEVEQATNNLTLLSTVLKPSRLLSQWSIDKESLHFLHTTFQEYLAAEALMKLEAHTRSVLITQALHNPTWHEVLRFTAGAATKEHHGFWDIIKSLAEEPDRYGLMHIRLSQLVAETGSTDGGKKLLGYDLRDQLWSHIKNGIGTDYFVDAFAQLDSADYIRRVQSAKDIPSKNLRTRLKRSLGKIRTTQSSSALMESLLFGDKDSAAVASYAVKDALNTADLQKLRVAVQNQSLTNDTRQMLIRAIGNKKDYLSIPLLCSLLGTAPDLQQEILRALGSIGGKEAANALAELFQASHDAKLKGEIIDALGRAFDLASRDVLIAVLAGVPPNDPIVDNVLAALCEIPVARHSNLISHYTDASYPEAIRVQAIWALMEATETHISETLARLGKSDPSEKVRITALAALRKRGSSFELGWLSERVQDESCHLVERANALEAIFGLYKRQQQGMFFSLVSQKQLHDEILELTRLGLQHPAGDLSQTAATSAYLLGDEIAPDLLALCTSADSSALIKESACLSLGKIKYKPALALLNEWIEKSPDIQDDEEIPLITEVDRLAHVAGQAYVQIDLIGATKHPSKAVKAAVGKFALENGYMVFPDRVILPNGKMLPTYPGVQNDHLILQSPKLSDNLSAIDQLDQIRAACKFLLRHNLACKTAAAGGNVVPPPLFHKGGNIKFTNGIDQGVGNKFLNGDTLSPKMVARLMDRLKEKFSVIFQE